jgi:hypothetical protein
MLKYTNIFVGRQTVGASYSDTEFMNVQFL